PVIVQLLENAVQKLNESQVTWRSYRDQYCDAVSFSYTTGSGSGTAMEECVYKTALLRVRQLRLDFPDSAAAKGHLRELRQDSSVRWNLTEPLPHMKRRHRHRSIHHLRALP